MYHLIYGGFRQETNTFSPLICTKEHFMAADTCFGEDIIPTKLKVHDHSTGMLEFLLSCDDVEFTPVAEYYAQSLGRVEQSVCDEFIEKMVTAIKNAKELDAVFLSLHGGMALTEEDDGIGHILEEIRKAVGPDMLIVSSSDLHAMITRKVMENVNLICGFHEYPHIDNYDTGYRTGKLGMEALRSGKWPHIACARIPTILQAEASNTLVDGPLKDVLDHARSLESSGKILDWSLYHLQPWLDCREAGASCVVIAETAEAAKKYADEIAARYFAIRRQLKYTPISVDEGLDRVLELQGKKLVVLSDAADNTSGGAAGDSVVVLKRILERKLDIKGAVCCADPAVARQAIELGEGAVAEFTVGGKLDPKRQGSVTFTGKVLKVFDPKTSDTLPCTKFGQVSFGDAALLGVRNMTVLVCQYPQLNTSAAQFLYFGIDISKLDMFLVKSSLQYKENCRKLTDELYNVNTPGSTSSDLLSLGFERIPRPTYPFDDTDDFGPAPAFEGRSVLYQ